MISADYRGFLNELCVVSGEIINRHYHPSRPVQVEHKSDDSPVTQADREAEQAMREMIRERYPDHGILAEEFGNRNESAEYVWVLDPIDGTVSYAAGCPLFGTLIGLLHRGRPILGAIHQPVLNQLCVGDGEGTTLNGESVRVSKVRSLADATLSTTDYMNVAKYQNFDGFSQLCQSCRTVRGWGDCYGYLMLVCGGIDIMLDPIVNPWDVLPLIPIVTGAGGSVTAWNGGDPITGNSCIATNPALYPEVKRMLNLESGMLDT